MTWPWVIVLAAGAYGFKLLGVSVATTSLMARWEPVTRHIPVALFVGLVVVLTLDGGRQITVDARLAGVAAGGLVAIRRGPFVAVVAVAMAVTAAIRAVSSM